jgi:hypothetical protein
MAVLGRPSLYNDLVINEICERISSGEGVDSICLDEHMPCEKTVYNWLETHEEFVQKYMRARERLADRDAFGIVKIADEELDPNRARVRIDARKWRASKLAPKKYCDKTTIASDPENPMPSQVTNIVITPEMLADAVKSINSEI